MFTFDALPASLSWHNEPAAFTTEGGALTISSGALTDWFLDPAGARAPKMDAPAALLTPPDDAFLFSARVTVDFGATYDAGALALHAGDDVWAKLCFEYSPQREPMVVSVVTRGASDDCNSTVIDGNSVWLRVHRDRRRLAYHYSLDGQYWHLVRHFTLGDVEDPRIGFLAQSPTGPGCTVTFDSISYRAAVLADLRSGE
jgi:regulation of enolase protein 1 (concanavalin A-like superfamily)